MNKTIFPQVLDSSTLSTYKQCPQKFFKTYIQNWRPKELSVHLHAGKCFASGLEAARHAFYEGYYERGSRMPGPDGKPQITYAVAPAPQGDADTAVALGLERLLFDYGNFECPPDSAKSAERTAGALEYYFTNYPLTHDSAVPITLGNGKRGIEFGFLHPLPVDHPETGEPILFSGRMDMLCNMAGGIYIEDDKTTTSLGATWAKNWDLRGQFDGYAWGCRESNIDATGVLVRGVSILKTKYDTQQAISYRPKWRVDRWLDETCVLIEEIIGYFKKGFWRHAVDDACSDFGGCTFRQACQSEDETSEMETRFTHRRWDPVTRSEIPL